MIYTVTLNPSIDYHIKLDSIKVGAINRSSQERCFAGGKGINVSIMLNRLGMKSIATGFVCGFTGSYIEHLVQCEGVSTDFVHLDTGTSRINVKIAGAEETEINGAGPLVPKASILELQSKFSKLSSSDIVIVSGNAPKDLSKEDFNSLLATIRSKQARLIVDISGKLLTESLTMKPFLVKPNLRELSEAVGEYKLTEERSIIDACRSLKIHGAQSVLVSMGDKGAILLDSNDRIHKIDGIQGQSISTIGSGDSLLAGFVYGLKKYGDLDCALRIANCVGAATAFSEGLATSTDISKILASGK